MLTQHLGIVGLTSDADLYNMKWVNGSPICIFIHSLRRNTGTKGVADEVDLM